MAAVISKGRARFRSLVGCDFACIYMPLATTEELEFLLQNNDNLQFALDIYPGKIFIHILATNYLKQNFICFPNSFKKQTPKEHSEMRGSYRVTVMRMLLTLLMLLDIKAWKMGQPPENVWVTLAKTLRQDNLCLSMGSVSSPLSSCLVGTPFKINEPSPLHPFAGTGLPCPPQKKDQPKKPGNSG
ncbi:hypothetical protein DUI87_35010 [Hirundo rustica rustica]|uniref:Uncharacterized protein n=1 Tax=Hirundo rustica rustica TaxID=333673 RepID=A0A3M0IJV2_HIRRU|nr:hypothetical protein DUI87_35010 [Hirundo rustica rustica]